jgi:hypothetical protein
MTKLVLSPSQAIDCRTADGVTQQTFQLGRVRGSNLHKLVNVLKRTVRDDDALRKYLHPEHRTATELKKDLGNLVNSGDSVKIKALSKRAIRPWTQLCMNTITPLAAAQHIVESVNQPALDELVKDLHSIMFRWQTTKNDLDHIQPIKNGIEAEIEIKKRILKDGIMLPHPTSKDMQLAKLEDVIDGDCFIGVTTPELSGRPDLTGCAVFLDGRRMSVVIEIKYFLHPVDDWLKLTTGCRAQVQAYALIAGDERKVFVLQGDASTHVPGSTHGSQCALQPVIAIDRNYVSKNSGAWIDWYCKLGRAILMTQHPEWFVPDKRVSTAVSSVTVQPRDTNKQRVADCNGGAPTLKFHVKPSTTDQFTETHPGRGSGVWFPLSTGFYLYGAYELNHTNHKATTSDANAKKFSKADLIDIQHRKVKIGETSRQLVLREGVTATKARNLQQAVRLTQNRYINYLHYLHSHTCDYINMHI